MEELLKKLEEAEEAANKADKAYEEEPENETIENEFDRAYKEEYKTFTEAAKEIVNITDGKIDLKTASLMLRSKRNEVKAIFA